MIKGNKLQEFGFVSDPFPLMPTARVNYWAGRPEEKQHLADVRLQQEWDNGASPPSSVTFAKTHLGGEYREPVLSKCIAKFRPCSCAYGEKNHELPGYLLNRLAGNVDLRPAMLNTFLLRVTKFILDVRQRGIRLDRNPEVANPDTSQFE